MLIFIYTLYLIFHVRLVHSAVCSDSTVGTANPPASYAASTDSDSNTAYVMTDASVQFSCCGRIKTWKFYASGSGLLKLQVWRLVSGARYKLVGENSFTIPAGAVNQEIHYEVAEEDRIQFITNDYIGWYTTGNPIISYSGPSGPDKTYYISTSVSSGNQYDFSSYRDNRFYAIIVDVTSNEDPYFDNIPSKVHVFDHLSVGSTVLTLEPKDTEDDDLTIGLNSASSYFQLDPLTYQVTVTSSLSVTSSRTETITPKATDICSVNRLETLSIFIENKRAIITSLPSSVEINETATAETLLHTITAVDGETLACVLDGVLPSTTVFQVKETSAGSGVYGIYYVPVSGTGFDFDYDSAVRYDVTATCTDGRLTSEAGHLMVYILKNKPPEFTNLPDDEVLPQQLTAAGTNIQVSVTDADSATLTYSIVCDPVGCPMSISTGGLITTTVDLSTIQVPGYDVYVTVNDGHTSVGAKSLSVHISNINDIPEFANYQLDSKIGVEENTAIGTLLFTYYTTELDNPDAVTYSWTSTPSTGTTYFSLGSSNGQITTAADLDFDTLADTSFIFAVEATDGKDTATTTVSLSIVNVNEAPSFSGASYIINDNEGVGESLLASASIAATDPDAGHTASLKFTLDCNGYNTTYFEMDENSARVYFGRDFDTDVGHPPVTECNVTVTDPAGLTDVESLTINIADTNDFTPSFSQELYTVFLFPSESVGTELGTFTATDGDISTTWSTIVYALDQTSLGGNYFAIDVNGTVTVAQDISAVFSYGQKVSIPMTATDGGGLFGTATLLLVFPETSTTSTTTTELPFKIENYADNGYWYSLAGIIVIMNTFMCIFLCYRYCDCRTPEIPETEAEKRAKRLRGLEQRKERARLKLLPTDDPWSIYLHHNYSKNEADKRQEKSSTIQYPTTNVNRSKDTTNGSINSRSENVRQSGISLNSISTDMTQRQSVDLYPDNQQPKQQQHHLYDSNTRRTNFSATESKVLW